MNEFQRIKKKDFISHKFIAFSKLDSKGRLLIPKKLRNKLDFSIVIILLNGERIELVPAKKKLKSKRLLLLRR